MDACTCCINGVEYRTLDWLPGYRIGSDGSVWSCRQVGGAYSVAGEWHQLKPARLPSNGKRRRSQAYQIGLRPIPGGRRIRYYIHRLVLEAFVRPPLPKELGCHEDGNPANNHLCNLRWDSAKGNSHDMIRHGTIMRGTRNHQSRFTPELVRQIREMASRMKQKDVAAALGVRKQTVNGIVLRKTWGWLE